MNIGEKLSELRNNILRDRSDLIAGDDDSLWSDETLLRYIKDGERRFVRQTLMIRDSTTAQVCQVKLKLGVQNYPLHQSVLGVLSARYNTDQFDLARSGHGIISQIVPPEFLSFDPSVAYQVQPGRPSAFNTDETLVFAGAGRVTFSIYPLPSAAEDGLMVNLRVLRLPLNSYTLDDLDVESEIPEDYELEPLQWAAYRAVANHDGDAGSSRDAEKYKAAFLEAVANAQKETKRKLFASMNFRFGMSGFTWER